MNWNAPPEVADLHPTVDGWARRHRWIKARKGGCFEAIYTKGTETRKIVIPENVSRNADASLWAIRRELKPRRKLFVRGTRPSRRNHGISTENHEGN